MPNWNYNSVEIHAPKDAVLERLIYQPAKPDDLTMSEHYRFNMHALFPEKFPVTDPT